MGNINRIDKAMVGMARVCKIALLNSKHKSNNSEYLSI